MRVLILLTAMASASFAQAQLPQSTMNCNCGVCGCIECICSNGVCRCPNCQASDYVAMQRKSLAENKPMLVIVNRQTVKTGAVNFQLDAPWPGECENGIVVNSLDGYPDGSAIWFAPDDERQWLHLSKVIHKPTKSSEIANAKPRLSYTNCANGKCAASYWSATTTRAAVGSHTHTCSRCNVTWDHVSNPGHNCPSCGATVTIQDRAPRPVMVRQAPIVTTQSINASSGGCSNGSCSTSSAPRGFGLLRR